MKQKSRIDISENTNIRLLLIPIATIIVLINNYWISSTWNGFSLNSLFINAVFITFIISLLTPLLRKIKKSLAPCPSEMLIIYMMLAVTTGVAVANYLKYPSGMNYLYIIYSLT